MIDFTRDRTDEEPRLVGTPLKSIFGPQVGPEDTAVSPCPSRAPKTTSQLRGRLSTGIPLSVQRPTLEASSPCLRPW